MNPGVHRMILATCAVAFLASLLPMPSQAGAHVGQATTCEPLFYALHAAPLGFPTDGVSVRFEYYRDEYLLEAEVVQLSFGGSESVLVPIPSSISSLHMQRGDSEIELRVFANDFLVDELDYTSLLQHNQRLHYTHARELASVTGLTPGDIENIDCGDRPPNACGNWGCLPHQDYDCDGVSNSTDNCVDDPNPGQANCDGDSAGNVCDGLDAIYQTIIPNKTCMTDKDEHVPPYYITFDHHVEKKQKDVSSCGAPDRWVRSIRMDNDCVNIGEYPCCLGLSSSIQAVGDNPGLWCGSRRNEDWCH